MSVEEQKIKSVARSRKWRAEKLKNDPNYLKDKAAYNRNWYANRMKDTDNAEKEVNKRKAWHDNNPNYDKDLYNKRLMDTPDYYKRRRIQYLYGITLEDRDRLLTSQNGCCAICGKSEGLFPQKLGVDHNHITEQVRGLLCLHCNLALGYLNDDIELFKSAINYLQKYNEDAKP